MDFTSKYRDRIRLTAIVCSLSFNFVMICASWADDSAAWITSIVIAFVAIVCALFCHFTHKQPK